jgi:hypothetical protein
LVKSFDAFGKPLLDMKQPDDMLSLHRQGKPVNKVDKRYVAVSDSLALVYCTVTKTIRRAS